MTEERVSRAAAAAEQLCIALWEALHEELGEGRIGRVVALSERLSEVCSSVATIAEGGRSAQAGVRALGAEGREAGAVFSGVGESSSVGATGGEVGRGECASGEGDVRRDARVPAGGTAADSLSEAARVFHSGAGDHERILGGRPATLVDEHGGFDRSIALKDVRGGPGRSPSAAVERMLHRHAIDSQPFSVLVFEILVVRDGRLRRTITDDLAHVRRAESAIIEQLHPDDELMRERNGRCWVIAPHADSAAARSLGERVRAAVLQSACGDRLLEVAVGIASCPEHGLDASALTAHADIDSCAAFNSNGSLRSDRGREMS
jgi:hypothetical protein